MSILIKNQGFELEIFADGDTFYSESGNEYFFNLDDGNSREREELCLALESLKKRCDVYRKRAEKAT